VSLCCCSRRHDLNPLVEARLSSKGQSEELTRTWEKIVKDRKTAAADTHQDKGKDSERIPPEPHHHDDAPNIQTAAALTPRAKSKSNSTSSLSLIL